jgi:hypothetical protein
LAQELSRQYLYGNESRQVFRVESVADLSAFANTVCFDRLGFLVHKIKYCN